MTGKLYMFISIEPTEYYYHKDILEPFLGYIKENPSLRWSFENHKNAIFIVSLDEARSIYGGAMLLKEKFSSLPREVQKNMKNLGLINKNVWTCTTLLYKKNNYSDQCEFFFETFYRDLYRKLVEFGVKEKTGFLYMMLEPGEYFCTEVLGCWPYINKIKLHDSLKDLSHGVLSLRENQSQSHIKTGRKKFPKEIKLAA
ncbi:MAG: hypothetical protein A2W46_00505 [Alphaproteobacteria bacterium RIFCSPHIGHO2_12_42_13]|nr:MAG: hypothetical protein A2Z80_06270 [Alphaproteobacteria bacterium GWA2_41_27]OFW82284.1 MAG: hypothetical protein A3E50_03670 [Alphaproteobacteria bacterium RIFCSPHIGHO2_12_FULL_42_100]OFW86110.1 MAG: hypothetical protein A2W06_00600 [Alphaproteobacteria bacterium RBG_16_42_14]OFW92687.1 MAG: hypothetical protein A2W46_00505 [Alphaproteobacteria bacterium RIFCSPHIGHO2_12_42_13]OFX07124.1 MAG: hypothetical protein A3H46_01795 [Alphaproteobacteria bacterium RIFCSPLOWO2_02_FULL_43_54]OFX080